MCSHTLLSRKAKEIARELDAEIARGLDVDGPDSIDRPRERIGPGEAQLFMRATNSDGSEGGAQRVIASGVLGLTGRTKKGLLINARSESVHRQAAFRDAFVRRRCLVPADGFYEWAGDKGSRVAWRFKRNDGGLLLIAALYEEHLDESGAAHTSFVILTTEANGVVGPVHDRMPVIVERALVDDWLRPPGVGEAAGLDAKRLFALLKPAANDVLLAEELGARKKTTRDEEVPEIPIARPRAAKRSAAPLFDEKATALQPATALVELSEAVPATDENKPVIHEQKAAGEEKPAQRGKRRKAEQLDLF